MLRDRTSAGGLHELMRRCALAVLTSGNDSDDPHAASALYPNFDLDLAQHDRGLRLELRNAPECAFVDGQIIRGIAALLFAVVRDMAYASVEFGAAQDADVEDGVIDESQALTEGVFGQLRNAQLLRRGDPNLVVCWGGHSISEVEYDYTKAVGYQLGLRGLDICTGCGPGAMKGPMKGAAIAHAKQRQQRPRYVGLTEPGIIAAESPNPIVNSLVVLPNIEARLEAFVRLGHGFVVFPGGVGTAEEILYLLGVLLCDQNKDIPFPLVFTGPVSSAAYFEQIDRFVRLTLGDEAASRYQIIIGDAVEVGRAMSRGMERVRAHRIAQRDAFFFNWSLHVPLPYQKRFDPLHENVAALRLHQGRGAPALAADLRRAFSAIVAGNVKEDGIAQVAQFGPYTLRGDHAMMEALDALLRAFVNQRRMKIEGEYRACYRVET